LEEIKNPHRKLVEEAILISEELNRTAMMLKETWYEGIEESWKLYSNERNIQGAMFILL
jgi:FKBP12-rapamycin complex-associated protein